LILKDKFHAHWKGVINCLLIFGGDASE